MQVSNFDINQPMFSKLCINWFYACQLYEYQSFEMNSLESIQPVANIPFVRVYVKF
jgi:hypothetical protein